MFIFPVIPVPAFAGTWLDWKIHYIAKIIHSPCHDLCLLCFFCLVSVLSLLQFPPACSLTPLSHLCSLILSCTHSPISLPTVFGLLEVSQHLSDPLFSSGCPPVLPPLLGFVFPVHFLFLVVFVSSWVVFLVFFLVSVIQLCRTFFSKWIVFFFILPPGFQFMSAPGSSFFTISDTWHASHKSETFSPWD